MIKDYVAAIAAQMEIKLSKITLVDGQKLGCLDAHLLKLSADGQDFSILVHQSELDELQKGSSRSQMEGRIRSALSRLQTITEPPQLLTEKLSMENRLSRRINVKDGNCVMVKNGFFIGAIENISLGGLLVTSDIKAKVMDRIDVSIILPSDSGGIAIEADMIATRVKNGSIALKYDYIDYMELSKLKPYLYGLA